MQIRKETLLSAALRYAELGYPVFPCAPGKKSPITPHGFKDATTDLAVIEAWWTKRPKANIGIPTAGLLVIDIDGAANPWPADPDKALDLARGPVSCTPRGGKHHIFRQPKGKAWRNTTSALAPKVDTRADGGYIVVPPSIVDDKSYNWAETQELDVPPDQLPEPPGWVVALLEDSASQGASWPPLNGNPIPDGQRNPTLTRLAGGMRRMGMSREEILAALMQVNQDRCDPQLSAPEVEKVATSISRYEADQVTVAVVEDHWSQDQAGDPQDNAAFSIPDPGQLPEELLRMPGLVSEVMDYCLATAPYPNTVMAFCGALALQAVLAGRKVRDPGDNRTNFYLLGLAHSAAGKDRPRQINTKILHQTGLSSQVGGCFASGEGVEDSLFVEPCMLFQTDEIDGMLQSINKAKDARHENMMRTLLTLYSSANSVYPMRRKAGKESPGVIDQPCLVLFGTAIPNHYYEALSERMLTNGFFARMIILECGRRASGQEPEIKPLPDRVLEVAKWWADLRPDEGNLEKWHPVPQIVRQTEEAKQILVETRLEAEAEYAKAEGAGDPVGTTVWGRVSENARKLALIYAVSENHTQPEIGKDAADWARRFIVHQTRRMLFMAQAFVADNPFHAECLKFLQKLREAPKQELPHSVMLKRMKMDAKNFLALVSTLQQRGDIVIRDQSSSGRPGRFYRLAESTTDEGERKG